MKIIKKNWKNKLELKRYQNKRLKDIKIEVERNRYGNISKEDKQKLKKCQKYYCEVKKNNYKKFFCLFIFMIKKNEWKNSFSDKDIGKNVLYKR